MKMLIIENDFNDLKKSRVPLGNYLEQNGFDVKYACPNPKGEGIIHIPMSRNTLSLVSLFKSIKILNSSVRGSNTTIIMSFRFIPNVLNYLNSFFNKDIKRIGVITGLGYAFTNSSNLVVFLKGRLIKLFYRIASGRLKIVSQNSEDLEDLAIYNGEVILGSGVQDSSNYKFSHFHTNTLKLIFVGRLLKSKGLFKAIEIFKEIKVRRPDTILTIAGSIDVDNPDSIGKEQLDNLIVEEGINYLGYVNDLNQIYSKSNVLLFPSIYREGVPRVIIESLLHGLTIVTLNMPGCKETIRNNGFLVENSHSTSDIVEYLSNLSSDELVRNNRESKTLFKEFFSADVIYPKYLKLLKEINLDCF